MKSRFGNVTAFLNFVEVKGITDLYWLNKKTKQKQHPSPPTTTTMKNPKPKQKQERKAR